MTRGHRGPSHLPAWVWLSRVEAQLGVFTGPLPGLWAQAGGPAGMCEAHGLGWEVTCLCAWEGFVDTRVKRAFPESSRQQRLHPSHEQEM